MGPETDGNGRGRTLKNGTTRACYHHFLAAIGACEGLEGFQMPGWSEKASNQMWDEITTEYHDEQNETVRNVGFLAARAGRLMI